MISAMMWLIAGGFEIVKISLRVFSEVFGVGLKMALVVAALASVPLQAHAAVFDVTTVDGMVINGTLDLNLPPDYRDTVFKNSNFSPTVPGAQTHMLTLDTTTLTGILESQLGALGAHEKYQINSATFTAGVAGTDQTRYLGGNDGTVHALTTAFNVDTATFNNSDTGVSWASGSLSSADYGVAITTGVQGADDTVYSGLGSTLQGWVDGGSNLGLVFETSTVVLGPTAWTDDVSIKLTIDAEIIDDNAPPVVITPPPGTELLVDLGQWGLSVTKFDYINVVFARDAGWIGSDDRQREPGRQLHHLGQ